MCLGRGRNCVALNNSLADALVGPRESGNILAREPTRPLLEKPPPLDGSPKFAGCREGGQRRDFNFLRIASKQYTDELLGLQRLGPISPASRSGVGRVIHERLGRATDLDRQLAQQMNLDRFAGMKQKRGRPLGPPSVRL